MKTPTITKNETAGIKTRRLRTRNDLICDGAADLGGAGRPGEVFLISLRLLFLLNLSWSGDLDFNKTV